MTIVVRCGRRETLTVARAPLVPLSFQPPPHPPHSTLTMADLEPLVVDNGTGVCPTSLSLSRAWLTLARRPR